MKNKFFNSKSNIILMMVGVIIAIIVISMVYAGKNTENSQGTEASKIAFLKKYVQENPKAAINECTSENGVKSLRISPDSSIAGSASTLYSFAGKELASCPVNPTVQKPAMCNEKADCAQVFYPAGAGAFGGVDIYKLKQ